MEQFYRQAAVLACTSEVEGFPNTFIEAWSHGLPVVSTFDPDGVIAGAHLGVVAQDVAGVAAGLTKLLAERAERRRISHRVRQYYLANHAMDAVIPQFERLFRDVVDVAGPRGNGGRRR